jgi:hypothetical protein
VSTVADLVERYFIAWRIRFEFADLSTEEFADLSTESETAAARMLRIAIVPRGWPRDR